MPPHAPRPLRHALLYGAALGLLVGLARVAVSGQNGETAIDLWRNTILAGAALGFFVGLARLAWRRHQSNDDVEEHQNPPSSERPSSPLP